jgi:hypothetical protein
MERLQSNATSLPDIKELDLLLSVLQSHNVYSFKCNGIEVLLSPVAQPLPVETPKIDESTGNYGIWSSKELA